MFVHHQRNRTPEVASTSLVVTQHCVSTHWSIYMCLLRCYAVALTSRQPMTFDLLFCHLIAMVGCTHFNSVVTPLFQQLGVTKRATLSQFANNSQAAVQCCFVRSASKIRRKNADAIVVVMQFNCRRLGLYFGEDLIIQHAK